MLWWIWFVNHGMVFRLAVGVSTSHRYTTRWLLHFSIKVECDKEKMKTQSRFRHKSWVCVTTFLEIQLKRFIARVNRASRRTPWHPTGTFIYLWNYGDVTASLPVDPTRRRRPSIFHIYIDTVYSLSQHISVTDWVKFTRAISASARAKKMNGTSEGEVCGRLKSSSNCRLIRSSTYAGETEIHIIQPTNDFSWSRNACTYCKRRRITRLGSMYGNNIQKAYHFISSLDSSTYGVKLCSSPQLP